MCEPTVTLPLSEYDRLRDFERDVNRCVLVKGLGDETRVIIYQYKLGQVIAQNKANLMELRWDEDRDHIIWTQKEAPTAQPAVEPTKKKIRS